MSSPGRRRAAPRWRSLFEPAPAAATAWYALATLAFTWPLVLGLPADIPEDLGDSLLNCWILGWGADHLVRFIRGDFAALAGFWNANIFYPEPLALAYSEHLFAQVVQVAPVFAATRNLLLCYNLLFLSTFVLSGLGMYLLVREITGAPRAAFVAGLLWAFAPYRVAQFSHLQVLSVQWMPLALVALRRHFDTRRLRPLAGAALALIAQNLSNGYYVLYFSPFVAAYAGFEVVARGRVRDVRQWAALAGAALVVCAATWPFLAPYGELRARGLPERPLQEVRWYSADVYSYVTAAENAGLDGRWFDARRKPEGQLFPGIVPLVLAAVALVPRARRAGAAWRVRVARLRWPRRLAARAAAGVTGTYVALAAVVLLGGGLQFRIGPVPIHLVHLNPLLLFAALAGVAAMLLARGVPRAHGEPGAADRRDGRAGAPPFLWFALAAVVVAGWLSLGPTVYSLGRRLDWGPYLFLYRHVPGFDGLRVPARLGMIAGLFLAVIAGVGAADLIRQWRYGAAAVFAAGLCFLAEVNPVPIAINRSVSDEPFGSLPARVETGDRVPGVYAFLRDTRPHAVVMEFPFGEYPLELRYVYYSTVHWCRLVNGFSGHFPASYERRRTVLRHPLESPDLAWRMVVESGATFLLVHESYFPAGNGREVSRWLERHGARAVVAFGPDRVFEIR